MEALAVQMRRLGEAMISATTAMGAVNADFALAIERDVASFNAQERRIYYRCVAEDVPHFEAVEIAQAVASVEGSGVSDARD